MGQQRFSILLEVSRRQAEEVGQSRRRLHGRCYRPGQPVDELKCQLGNRLRLRQRQRHSPSVPDTEIRRAGLGRRTYRSQLSWDRISDLGPPRYGGSPSCGGPSTTADAFAAVRVTHPRRVRPRWPGGGPDPAWISGGSDSVGRHGSRVFSLSLSLSRLSVPEPPSRGYPNCVHDENEVRRFSDEKPDETRRTWAGAEGRRSIYPRPNRRPASSRTCWSHQPMWHR
jgi:hypothetical protein